MNTKISSKRSRVGVVAAAMVVVVLSAFWVEGDAYANGGESIRKICDWRWPTNEKAQELCRESQSASARELMLEIENEVAGSTPFVFAEACIEKFRLLPPQGIDWVQALSCFRTRIERVPVKDEPSE